MQTSENGLALIEANEGLVLTVQADTGGKRVIGYGHDLLPGETFPNGITQEQAVCLLNEDVAEWDAAINALNWTLTQNQHDALADFTHECGIGALQQLAAHGIAQVPAQLPRWVHAKVRGVEVVLAGMVARRAKEVALWNA